MISLKPLFGCFIFLKSQVLGRLYDVIFFKKLRHLITKPANDMCILKVIKERASESHSCQHYKKFTALLSPYQIRERVILLALYRGVLNLCCLSVSVKTVFQAIHLLFIDFMTALGTLAIFSVLKYYKAVVHVYDVFA